LRRKIRLGLLRLKEVQNAIIETKLQAHVYLKKTKKTAYYKVAQVHILKKL